MNAHSRLIPASIRSESEAMIRKLQEDNESFRQANVAMAGYSNDDTLQSGGFEYYKQLMREDFRMVSNAFVMANEADIADHQKLMTIVDEAINEVGAVREKGERGLIGSVILRQLERRLNRRIHYENRMAHYQSIRDNTSWVQRKLMFWDWTYSAAQSSQREVERAHALNEEMIKRYERMIDKYNEVEQATKNLFTTGAELRAKAKAGLEHIQHAVAGLPDTYHAPGLENWRQDIGTLKDDMMSERLAKLGLTPEQVQFARDLGYTPQELLALFNSFVTDEEKQFFQHLLSGTAESFAQAFKMNPHLLSSGITIAMSDFSMRLFENDMGKFTHFVNAVLGADGNAFAVTQNREIFLERLFAGTYTMLGYNAFMIATGVGSEEDQLRFNHQKALSGFWASLSIITNELRSNMWESSFVNLSISDIRSNENGSIYFDLSYRCPVALEQRAITVRNYIEIDGQQLDENRAIERLNHLRRTQEELANQLFLDILGSGSRTALLIAIPPMGAFFKAMDMVSNVPNSVSGFAQLTDNQGVKDGIMVGNFSLQIVQGFMAWNNRSNALSETERETFIEWFGAGVTTRFNLEGISNQPVTAIEGLYNPNTIQKVLTWQENGLVGLGVLNQNQVNEILDSPEFSDFGSSVQADIEALLIGGFPILDESGFRAERFLIAVSDINRILDRLDVNIRIQTAWNDLIQGD